MRLWLDDAWFSSQQWQENILFSRTSRQVLGSPQSPIQWVPSVLSLGVKWLQGEVHCSPPSSAKIKNESSYIATPLYTICLHGLERENVTLYYKNNQNTSTLVHSETQSEHSDSDQSVWLLMLFRCAHCTNTSSKLSPNKSCPKMAKSASSYIYSQWLMAQFYGPSVYVV